MIKKPSQMFGLIGHTGFVGTNLKLNKIFDFNYNSKNIELIKDVKFDTLICAAAPGSMIYANSNAKDDKENIEKLLENLKKCSAKKLILISTIGVFKDFNKGHNEDSDSFEDELAYGVNRRYLEKKLIEMFDKVHIIRLPSLFGNNLKKNFLFDLLNPMPSFLKVERFELMLSLMNYYERDFLATCFKEDKVKGLYYLDRDIYNQYKNKTSIETKLQEGQLSSIYFHSHQSNYQFYNLKFLWEDISLIINNDIGLAHLAPPPIQVGEIYDIIYNSTMPANEAKIHTEDLQTNYSLLWNATEPYIQSADVILSDIKEFFKSNRH